MVFDAKKPHVVILPSPGIGHMTPMLELAKRLVLHHSCHVTFLRITTQTSAAHTRLLHHLPPGLDVVDLPPADISALISDKTKYLHNLCITIRESLLCLKPTLVKMEEKPHALITDLFCTQALETCRDLSIPFYVFSTISGLQLAFSFLCLDLNPDEVDAPGVQFIHLPGCAPLRKEDLPFKSFSEMDQWYVYHLRRVTMADGILMNTSEDLEPVPVRAIREHPFYKQIPAPLIFPVGPLVKDSEPVNEKEEECLAWLNKQASGSVLFVALGSAGNLCAEQLTELAWGLELSQQRFIWVARPPAGVSGISSYFKVGGAENDPEAYLPEGFVQRTRELGMVVASWAPQLSVLKHESTGAFLSHCGWNSVLESVSHGVPLITWPLCADQMMSATFLVEGLGVAIKPVVEAGRKVIGRKEIERVVREVMVGEEGKKMRERARELKESALKTVQCGGKSYEALANVVGHVRMIN
ncbi:anthocyanidin 3-O-glucosyltransferase 5-like [Lotus japonicus]|uniref:anthocyanidin 3-O-glucosyltransferase 5-like n=1 Tax=Lotus japonicus TaxID=34305 RepID=UPI0025877804|nr:anthocyanidin 3-O-glucosyltransferase 5-like [Lotus japonicus]